MKKMNETEMMNTNGGCGYFCKLCGQFCLTKLGAGVHALNKHKKYAWANIFKAN